MRKRCVYYIRRQAGEREEAAPRAAAGIPLSEYVIAARLNRARFLLRETDQKLSRIAESLGYQDVSFFCRQFKNRTGYSPGQFRRQSRPDSRLPDSRS